MKWHAALWIPSVGGAGTSDAHRSVAMGHLVRKVHPDGGSIGLGISPCRIILSLLRRRGSGSGTAEISDFVYGCRGFEKISSDVPVSTIRPRYMTHTRSEMYRTTDRSWEMKRYVADPL